VQLSSHDTEEETEACKGPSCGATRATFFERGGGESAMEGKGKMRGTEKRRGEERDERWTCQYRV